MVNIKKLLSILAFGLFTLSACNSTEVIQGPAGEQGEQGPKGEAGKDGKTLLTGYGKPAVGLGTNGDSYIDLSTWDYYVKESLEWVYKGTIKGLDGQDGIDGLNGKEGQNGQNGQDGKNGSDGVSITSTYINDNGDLIIEYSNGQSQNVGHLVNKENYVVNFYVGDTKVATREVKPGSKISRPTSEETAGYTINYWYSIEDGYKEIWYFSGFVVNCDLDLYADYTANNYTISFVDEIHYLEFEPILVEFNSSFELPTSNEIIGYHINWIDDSGTIFSDDSNYLVPRDLLLKASWEANIYKINYDTNGGAFDFGSTYSIDYMYDNYSVKSFVVSSGNSFDLYENISEKGELGFVMGIYSDWSKKKKIETPFEIYSDTVFHVKTDYPTITYKCNDLYTMLRGSFGNKIESKSTERYFVDDFLSSFRLKVQVNTIPGNIHYSDDISVVQLRNALDNSVLLNYAASDLKNNNTIDLEYRSAVGQVLEFYINSSFVQSYNARYTIYNPERKRLVFPVGERTRTIDVSFDSVPVLPSNPSRDGYSFVGWFDENDEMYVLSKWNRLLDLNLKAKWIENR